MCGRIGINDDGVDENIGEICETWLELEREWRERVCVCVVCVEESN